MQYSSFIAGCGLRSHLDSLWISSGGLLLAKPGDGTLRNELLSLVKEPVKWRF